MHGEARLCSRTIGMGIQIMRTPPGQQGFMERFVVSHTALETTERHFLMNDRLYKATWLGILSNTFWFPMRIHQFNNFTTYTGDIQRYNLLSYLVKIIETSIF